MGGEGVLCEGVHQGVEQVFKMCQFEIQRINIVLHSRAKKANW